MREAYYHVHPSPIGDLLLVMSDRGVMRVTTLDARSGESAAVADTAESVGLPLTRDPAALGPLADEVDDYFAGESTDFSVPVDWSIVSGFTRDALRAICEIPYGETASYGEVAVLAGRPRAHRAVGHDLHAYTDLPDRPRAPGDPVGWDARRVRRSGAQAAAARSGVPLVRVRADSPRRPPSLVRVASGRSPSRRRTR